jgi:DUF917 family protein
MSAPRDTSKVLGGSVGHPSPARGAVGLVSLWFGLGGGAAAWSVLTIVNYAIASQQCYPRMAPLALPMMGARNLSMVLFATSGAAIVIGVIATIVAFRSWRRTSNESGGSTHWALETGEGRTRFMAVSGLMASAVFLLAIIVETISIVTVHPCW